MSETKESVVNILEQKYYQEGQKFRGENYPKERWPGIHGFFLHKIDNDEKDEKGENYVRRIIVGNAFKGYTLGTGGAFDPIKDSNPNAAVPTLIVNTLPRRIEEEQHHLPFLSKLIQKSLQEAKHSWYCTNHTADTPKGEHTHAFGVVNATDSVKQDELSKHLRQLEDKARAAFQLGKILEHPKSGLLSSLKNQELNKVEYVTKLQQQLLKIMKDNSANLCQPLQATIREFVEADPTDLLKGDLVITKNEKGMDSCAFLEKVRKYTEYGPYNQDEQKPFYHLVSPAHLIYQAIYHDRLINNVNPEQERFIKQREIVIDSENGVKIKLFSASFKDFYRAISGTGPEHDQIRSILEPKTKAEKAEYGKVFQTLNQQYKTNYNPNYFSEKIKLAKEAAEVAAAEAAAAAAEAVVQKPLPAAQTRVEQQGQGHGASQARFLAPPPPPPPPSSSSTSAGEKEPLLPKNQKQQGEVIQIEEEPAQRKKGFCCR